MNERSLNASNPFSTRFVRPGAIEYLFPEGWSADRVIDALAANKWRGAIIGPHGSGKSTLLATLLPQLEDRGIRPHLISLHDGQRWLPGGWNLDVDDHVLAPARPKEEKRHLMVIDGYEQLNRFPRWLLNYRCRCRGWGLLVTTHAPVSLPAIFEAKTSLESLRTILERLIPRDVAIITPEIAAAAYARNGGNVRETLFDLYDRFDELSHRMANRGPAPTVETS